MACVTKTVYTIKKESYYKVHTVCMKVGRVDSVICVSLCFIR